MSRITSIGTILSSRNRVTKLRKINYLSLNGNRKPSYTVQQVEKLANDMLTNNPKMKISEAYIEAERMHVKGYRG